MLEACRTSRKAPQGRPAGIALATLVAVTLGLPLTGCHSATNSGSAGSPLASWPQSPFTSQHDQMTKAVKNDPFPDANQPIRPVNADVTCHEQGS
jgi:hypothetical protein